MPLFVGKQLQGFGATLVAANQTFNKLSLNMYSHHKIPVRLLPLMKNVMCVLIMGIWHSILAWNVTQSFGFQVCLFIKSHILNKSLKPPKKHRSQSLNTALFKQSPKQERVFKQSRLDELSSFSVDTRERFMCRPQRGQKDVCRCYEV